MRGLPSYQGKDGLKKGMNQGWLVKLPDEVWKGDPQRSRASWVRPELMGYLLHLQDRLARLNGRTTRLPIVELGEPIGDTPGWAQELSGKGVSVRFSGADLSAQERKNLEKELQQDYLFDRVYLRSGRNEFHVVVNPRFGHEFLKTFEARSGVKRVGADN